MNDSLSHQIQIFKSVFKGREDVFAVRWEKGNKSGYMPAYSYDPYMYRVHKMKGGTFQNYQDKTYLKLTDSEIAKHLNGEQLIGIYPLLRDNTSWFLVADFDKANWVEEAKTFIHACQKKGIPAYLERSRSGNGGHVWIFFDQPYSAVRSRKIFISLLEQSGVFSLFDKNSSFDRLFPNQDFLSGKGLGNLIALPLFKKSVEQGNSCFIDLETLQPIPNQWNFLKNIQRVSIAQLDKLHQEISNIRVENPQLNLQGELTITLDNVIKISRSVITMPLINYIRNELNFANSEFIIKKKIGKSTFETERYFKIVEETETEIIIPKGFVGKLIRFCKESQIEYDFIDNRKKSESVLYQFNATLRNYQEPVIENISRKDIGVIVAPPGSGKTLLGLKIICEKQQSALIIVHRKQLLEQWVERIENFLGIPKNEIGRIGQEKSKIGKKITIATIQSLSKALDNSDTQNLASKFGTIIIDECHHIPAETFRNTITKLHSFYLYGLTATPFRKYNDGKLIFSYLGEIIAEIKPTEISTYKHAKIVVKNTELDVPYNSKTDKFEVLSQILIHDSARNRLIFNDIKQELDKGKKAVIITERKEHIDSLYQYLKQSYEAVTLSGEDSENQRKTKWKSLQEGNYQVLITTGQFFGEGSDLQNANCLFLVYPFSFEGKLIQYMGRVQRSEIAPTIYDYRDYKIYYLNKLFLKRNVFYRKINRQPSLFDEPIEETTLPDTTFTIKETLKTPIENLDFRYGSITFKYLIEKTQAEIEFEIENLEIRPEFEVLKPYFSKILKSKNISVDIYAEFEKGILVSQLATSPDIQKINREIIESVRFRYINQRFLELKSKITKETLLTLNEVEGEKQTLYADSEELLEDILQHKNYKHSRQLRYLSQLHERKFLKIRFVLNPFSFVFLLSGNQQFHLVLETLDSEEATYLWHINKDKESLVNAIKEIDLQLNFIRNKGRQAFLDTNPQNFSKILHDYSDEKKGFITWKCLLEEQLV